MNRLPFTRMRRSASVFSAVVSLLLTIQLALAQPALAVTQSNVTPGLLVTPSTIVLARGDSSQLSAIDESGRPVSNVQWSLSEPIATVQEEGGQVFLQGREAGKATLTATADGQSASAIITVVADNKLAPGTIHWSLQPIPGFQTLLVVQAVPTDDAPALYSIEWSKSQNAIVRALRLSGQQMWMTRVASSASPATLKQNLPQAGQVFEDGKMVAGDYSEVLIGAKQRVFFANNQSTPDSLKLPPEGKSVLLHATGDASGGMILLERSRSGDSIVDLNPEDGSELWRYRSQGRLEKNWTANWNMDVAIVEELVHPPSSDLVVLNAQTGQVRYRIPFPESSSTVEGFRCKEAHPVLLKSIRPSRAGSLLTSTDGNIYVQVETHVESLRMESCQSKYYTFDNSLALLSVTPEGETDWKVFQRVHAEGEGDFIPQPRVFAGETIPDGFGGVLAAWTYLLPKSEIHSEARLSRIGPSSQHDFTLPMAYWSKGLSTFFDSNMVLGEGNALYAIDGPLLLRMNTESGEVSWVRHPPTGEVKLSYATAGGGVLVSNAGRLAYFNAQGDGAPLPWTVAVSNPEDIGLVLVDPQEKKALDPIQLRDVQLCWGGNFIAVEDGQPYGQGELIYFSAK